MKIFFRLFIYISFIFNYISYANSQQVQNPLQKFKCTSPNHNLKVGDEVILCIHIIHIIPNDKKAAIKIKVDEYNMLSFNKIYDLIGSGNIKLELVAQIGDIVTKIPTVRKLNKFIYLN